MDTKDYNEKLLEYIYGGLSKEEEASFKEELKQNPEEARGVELRKRIVDRAKGEKQLEEILNDPGFEQAEIEAVKAIKEYDRHKRRQYLLSKQFRNKYVVPIAASIAAILYFGNLAFFIATPELAFKKYYKEYEPIYYAQATINEAQALYVHSFDAYTKGDYEAVAENMHTLMEEGNLNVRGQIMLAFYDAWTKEFIKKEDPNQMFKEDATWALAITAYKLGELEEAQELFHKIATEKYKRAGKAARMERKVSKMILEE